VGRSGQRRHDRRSRPRCALPGCRRGRRHQPNSTLSAAPRGRG
jgi:hypothetical protein